MRLGTWSAKLAICGLATCVSACRVDVLLVQSVHEHTCIRLNRFYMQSLSTAAAPQLEDETVGEEEDEDGDDQGILNRGT